MEPRSESGDDTWLAASCVGESDSQPLLCQHMIQDEIDDKPGRSYLYEAHEHGLVM